MRNTRPRHSELPEDAKMKANARSYLHVYIKRGKIIKGPCIVCGDVNTEAHHQDYSKPLDVTWLCKEHHDVVHSVYR